MAVAMTNPMDALVSFQKALTDSKISPQKAELHDDLLFLIDHPNGDLRITYALTKARHVVALVTIIPADSMNGFPCFNVGYAVDEVHRSQGYGKEVIQKAFDELANGFQPRFPHLYLEAIVSTTNEHSKKLANKLFSKNPSTCIDSVSGQDALQYVRQLF